MDAKTAISQYRAIYRALYNREPSTLRHLGGEWVLVNGARMTTSDLDRLTAALREELLAKRRRPGRNLILRLISWLTK